MTGSVDNQNILLTAWQVGTNAEFTLGFVRTSGVRSVLATITDTAGGSTNISAVLPAGDVPHTAQLDFNGATYTLYLDGIAVGSNTPALPSLSEINYLNLAMQPVNTGTSMSTSKIQITDCVVGPVIGWFDPVQDVDKGVAAEPNSGTQVIAGEEFFYFGVVGYTSGTVVWNLIWTPTVAGTDPILTGTAPGNKTLDIWPPGAGGAEGSGVISAAVDGIAAVNSIMFSMANDGTFTWGPVPR